MVSRTCLPAYRPGSSLRYFRFDVAADLSCSVEVLLRNSFYKPQTAKESVVVNNSFVPIVVNRA